MIVIEIAGKKGAGKTTLASHLAYYYGNEGLTVYRTSFASALKKLIRSVGLSKTRIIRHITWPDFWGELQSECQKLLKKSGYTKKSDWFDFNQLFTSNLDKIKEGYNFAFYQDKVAEGYRIIAQVLGTEVFRAFDEDFWVKQVKAQLKQVESVADIVIIDDYRFFNEFLSDFNTYAIRLELMGYKENDTHPSETEVENVPYHLKVIRKGNNYFPKLEMIPAFIAGFFAKKCDSKTYNLIA